MDRHGVRDKQLLPTNPVPANMRTIFNQAEQNQDTSAEDLKWISEKTLILDRRFTLKLH